MPGRRIDGIAEINHEGVTPPPEALLDIRIRGVLAVEEVAGRDPGGVRRPAFDVSTTRTETEDAGR